MRCMVYDKSLIRKSVACVYATDNSYYRVCDNKLEIDKNEYYIGSDITTPQSYYFLCKSNYLYVSVEVIV